MRCGRGLLLPLISVISITSIVNAQGEQRTLSERIAFACEHKPTLSFCGGRQAQESSGSPSVATAASTTPERQLPRGRRNDEPEPKRRWIFIPDTALEKSLNPSEKPKQKRKEEASSSSAFSLQPELELIVPPEPFAEKQSSAPKRALQSRTFPVLPSDAAYGAGQVAGSNDPFAAVNGLTDDRGLAHRPRSRSPFTKPGLWEPNPDDPHSRDPANKFWYAPESVGADWLNGQLQWGGHWAVPAIGVGGTNGQSAVHFPSIGTFLGIPDDYD